jgi:antitoxin MazE
MVVTAQVVKWGNSLAVRIPKSVADKAEFREGDRLILEAESPGAIAIKAAKAPITLSDLVSRITPENLHEVSDWGESMGNEAW